MCVNLSVCVSCLYAGMVVADIRQLKKVEASDLNDFIPNIDGAQVFLKHGPST